MKSGTLVEICLWPHLAVKGLTCSLEKERDLFNHLLNMDGLKLYDIKEDQKDSLVQSVRVISTDSYMEFGINKCTTLIMKRGKAIQTEGIDLPAKGKIKSLDKDSEGYKYLGWVI